MLKEACAERLEEAVLHFDLGAAAVADQMVVRVAHKLVLHLAPAEVGDGHNAQGAEQLKRAVDGGLIGGGVALSYRGEDAVNRKVASAPGKGLDDHEPAPGQAVPLHAQPPVHLACALVYAGLGCAPHTISIPKMMLS